jgi:hypothetical protein
LLIGLAALGVPLLVLSAGSEAPARLSAEARFWVGLFVPYMAYVAGSQHGAASLAYEGRNLAVLRSAPIGFTRLLLAKLAGSTVLVLGITWLATLVLAIRHGGTAGEIAAALVVASWLAVGGTTAGLVGAALTADFETDNPQRRVGCFGTLITSGLPAVFFVSNTLLVWCRCGRRVGCRARSSAGGVGPGGRRAGARVDRSARGWCATGVQRLRTGR